MERGCLYQPRYLYYSRDRLILLGVLGSAGLYIISPQHGPRIVLVVLANLQMQWGHFCQETIKPLRPDSLDLHHPQPMSRCACSGLAFVQPHGREAEVWRVGG